ncbi:unnamed protein product (macronuclear) [Paramecium tetraurelia]|uniref:Uncharacterized protein n=1 Tax=Paramecium tetraurelia TaxID=5888 RepID=A0BR44_PARTE|nr:uncharacterized protein GSPATT00031240001 [Paramecium tetraurelia]CAK61011.1 unnamed protein product [Paramecium tetraurelia]|eukprot:XP_001428409.1 hypothetical protein (macronuclear) [Paramecium tetraurelia strain d4-2]
MHPKQIDMVYQLCKLFKKVILLYSILQFDLIDFPNLIQRTRCLIDYNIKFGYIKNNFPNQLTSSLKETLLLDKFKISKCVFPFDLLKVLLFSLQHPKMDVKMSRNKFGQFMTLKNLDKRNLIKTQLYREDISIRILLVNYIQLILI